MKITAADLAVLQAAVAPLDTAERRTVYQNNQFPRSEFVKDKDKRYRWDLLYMSKLKLGDGVGIKGDLNLYAYLNDTHIDSALKSFVPTLH